MSLLNELFNSIKIWAKKNPKKATCAALGAFIVGGLYTGGALLFTVPVLTLLCTVVGAVVGGAFIAGIPLLSQTKKEDRIKSLTLSKFALAAAIYLISFSVMLLLPPAAPIALAFAGVFFSLLGALAANKGASVCMKKGWLSEEIANDPAAEAGPENVNLIPKHAHSAAPNEHAPEPGTSTAGIAGALPFFKKQQLATGVKNLLSSVPDAGRIQGDDASVAPPASANIEQAKSRAHNQHSVNEGLSVDKPSSPRFA